MEPKQPSIHAFFGATKSAGSRRGASGNLQRAAGAEDAHQEGTPEEGLARGADKVHCAPRIQTNQLSFGGEVCDCCDMYRLG
jgi:hypothetical protein